MKKNLFPTLTNLKPTSFLSEFEEMFNHMGENLTGPSVNVSTNSYGHLVEVAAPGLHKEDFHVEVDDNALTIWAEHKNTKEDNQRQYTRKEFSYTSFKRIFTLPQDVNPEDISAAYENGILRIVLGKHEVKKQERAKTITID